MPLPAVAFRSDTCCKNVSARVGVLAAASLALNRIPLTSLPTLGFSISTWPKFCAPPYQFWTSAVIPQAYVAGVALLPFIVSAAVAVALKSPPNVVHAVPVKRFVHVTDDSCHKFVTGCIS